tara:strand:+ start:383 stop:901 length:519 start_codon:yes stop_codon:yes gene_type:complete
MTTIDLRKISLKIGQALERDVELGLEEILIGAQRFSFFPSEPVGCLTLSRALTGMVFKLSFETSLQGPCLRCLNDSRTRVSVDVSEYEAMDATPDPDELQNPYLEDEILDLSSWARDAVILALPGKILCRDECAGLCSSCGFPHSEGECDCGPPPPDTRWEKLEELRKELAG